MAPTALHSHVSISSLASQSLAANLLCRAAQVCHVPPPHPSPSPRLNHPRARPTPSTRLSTRTPLASPPPPSLEGSFCFSQRLPSFLDVVSLTSPHPHKQSSEAGPGAPPRAPLGSAPSPLPDLCSDRERSLQLASVTATTGSPGLGIQKVLNQGLLKKQTKVRSQAAGQKRRLKAEAAPPWPG